MQEDFSQMDSKKQSRLYATIKSDFDIKRGGRNIQTDRNCQNQNWQSRGINYDANPRYNWNNQQKSKFADTGCNSRKDFSKSKGFYEQLPSNLETCELQEGQNNLDLDPDMLYQVNCQQQNFVPKNVFPKMSEKTPSTTCAPNANFCNRIQIPKSKHFHSDNYKQLRGGLLQRRDSQLSGQQANLQANCQFVLRKSALTSSAIESILRNPEHLIDWSVVELVYVKHITCVGDSTSKLHQSLCCPICQDEPLAAMMPRCGHVYCWPCLLRLFAFDESNRSQEKPDANQRITYKCPVCAILFFEEDLRPAVIVKFNNYQVGSIMNMKLMCRKRSTVFALPVSAQTHGSINKIGTEELPTMKEAHENNIFPFLKVMVLSDQEIIKDVLERLQLELDMFLNISFSVGDGESMQPHVQHAFSILSKRINKLQLGEEACGSSCNLIVEKSDPPYDLPIKYSQISSKVSKSYTSAFDDIYDVPPPQIDNLADSSENKHEILFETNTADSSIIKKETCELNLSTSLTISLDEYEDNDDAYYFYQSSDGQNIFLHSINWNCILWQFDRMSSASSVNKSAPSVNYPLTIAGPILEMNSLFSNSDGSKRFKYLSYLPTACPVFICELNLENILNTKTLDYFKRKLADRELYRAESRRAERLKQERRTRTLFHEESYEGEEERWKYMRRIPSAFAELQVSSYAKPTTGQFTNDGAVFSELDFVPLGTIDPFITSSLEGDSGSSTLQHGPSEDVSAQLSTETSVSNLDLMPTNPQVSFAQMLKFPSNSKPLKISAGGGGTIKSLTSGNIKSAASVWGKPQFSGPLSADPSGCSTTAATHSDDEANECRAPPGKLQLGDLVMRNVSSGSKQNKDKKRQKKQQKKTNASSSSSDSKILYDFDL